MHRGMAGLDDSTRHKCTERLTVEDLQSNRHFTCLVRRRGPGDPLERIFNENFAAASEATRDAQPR